jgi:F0F1-type ATP synthase delta subunit
MGETSKIIASYEDLMQTAKGIVKAVVTSAEPLKKKSADLVSDAISKMAGKDKTVPCNLLISKIY